MPERNELMKVYKKKERLREREREGGVREVGSE